MVLKWTPKPLFNQTTKGCGLIQKCLLYKDKRRNKGIKSFSEKRNKRDGSQRIAKISKFFVVEVFLLKSVVVIQYDLVADPSHDDPRFSQIMSLSLVCIV